MSRLYHRATSGLAELPPRFSGTDTTASPTTPSWTAYECPQGEILTLETFDDRNTLANYPPASSCNECMLKVFRTPHDEGRHVYRSPAEFHETMLAGSTACCRCWSSWLRWHSPPAA